MNTYKAPFGDSLDRLGVGVATVGFLSFLVYYSVIQRAADGLTNPLAWGFGLTIFTLTGLGIALRKHLAEFFG